MSKPDEAPKPQPSLFSVSPNEWETSGLLKMYPDIHPNSYLARLAMTNYEELQACTAAELEPNNPTLRTVMNFGDTFQRIYESVTRQYALGDSYEAAVEAAREHMVNSLVNTPTELFGQGVFPYERIGDITAIITCYTAEADIHKEHFYGGDDAMGSGT